MQTSLVVVKKLLHDFIGYVEYAIKYTETLIIPEVAIQFVFSISGSIALQNTAQFNCQFLCVSKVLPSSILALSGGEL